MTFSRGTTGNDCEKDHVGLSLVRALSNRFILK